MGIRRVWPRYRKHTCLRIQTRLTRTYVYPYMHTSMSVIQILTHTNYTWMFHLSADPLPLQGKSGVWRHMPSPCFPPPRVPKTSSLKWPGSAATDPDLYFLRFELLSSSNALSKQLWNQFLFPKKVPKSNKHRIKNNVCIRLRVLIDVHSQIYDTSPPN